MTQRSFASYGPGAKLTMWLGGVAMIAIGIELLMIALGVEFRVFSTGGSVILMTLALGGLVMLMAFDPRPLHEYGLVARKGWSRQFWIAFVVGAVSLSLYYVLITQTGAMRVPSHMRNIWPQVPRSILSASYAFFLSPVTQIIFAGYMLGLLRQRYSRATSIIVASFLFAVLYSFSRMEEVAAVFQQFQSQDVEIHKRASQCQSRFIAMFLIMAMTATMRLVHGHIFVGTGLMAGWIAVSRAARKSDIILSPDPDSKWLVQWLIPHGNVRMAPALWGLILLGIAVYAVILWRRGEPEFEDASKQMDASFKRVYPLAQPNMLAPLDLWLGRLVQARFRIEPPYIARFICSMAFSAINTVLTLPERLVAPLLVSWHKVQPPLFIVGVHRSGTTHLHNLLSLDDQMVTPRLYHVMNPHGCIFSGWLWFPIMACTPNRRPMDNMRLHVFSANEEEFAICNMSSVSPYWGFVFPRQGAAYDELKLEENFSDGQKKRWKSCYMAFLRRLTFFSRRRPLLKNPVNTGRVGMLAEMFPDAKFVHIRRHPYDVYRSNMHLSEQGIILYQLQDDPPGDSYCSRFPDNYVQMEDAYERDAAKLGPDQIVDLRFEELEKNPIGCIEKIYQTLGLKISDTFRKRLDAYMESVKEYRKNRYASVDPELAAQLNPKFEKLFDRGGYEMPDAAASDSESATQTHDATHPDVSAAASSGKPEPA